jgi:hypothetical protein
MPRVKPVVEVVADETTKNIAGAAETDNIPDAGATGGAEQRQTYIKVLGVAIYNIIKIRT